jgi:Peptidase family M1 domain
MNALKILTPFCLLGFVFFVSAEGLPSYDASLFTKDVIAEVVPVVETLQAPLYRLELILSDDLLSLQGSATILVTNTSQDSWNELVFRLYPNALGSSMVVSKTLVNDLEVIPMLDVKETVLRVPVLLEPEEQVVVTFTYTLTLSQEPLGYGRLANYQDVLSLSHAYPTLSVYNNGAWLDDYPPELGDPLVAETSLFEVILDAPKDWQIITTGQTQGQTVKQNRQTLSISTGPVRDFYIAAALGFNEVSKQVGETTIRVFAPQKFSESAASALETSAKALTVFSKLYAPYPYREFDIVAIPVEAGGIEYPGVIVVASGLFANPFGRFGSVLVHEIAHQWSFNLVGSDQINSPWLDESLTQYLTWRFQKEVNPRFITGFETFWQNVWNAAPHPEMPIGLPVAAFDEASYSGIVYGKGLFFFKTLAKDMGQETFDEALRSYFETYAWRFVSANELEGGLERSCSCELSTMFDEWVGK